VDDQAKHPSEPPRTITGVMSSRHTSTARTSLQGVRLLTSPAARSAAEATTVPQSPNLSADSVATSTGHRKSFSAQNAAIPLQRSLPLQDVISSLPTAPRTERR